MKTFCRPFLALLIGCLPSLCRAATPETVPDERQQLKQWLDDSYEYRFSNPDSSLYYGFKVLDAAKASNLRDVEADALRSLSTTYQAQGDYPRALEYGFEALRLSRELDDPLKTAHTLNILGITYDQQGNFPEALHHYREAYTMYKALGDDEWLAMIAVNLGILFKGQGEYEQVIPYYRDAYAIYRKLGLPAETAFCETNLGSVFYYTQQYDSCVYYSLKAEKALAEQGYLQIQPTAQSNAGLGYFGLGRFGEAKDYLEKALAAHRKYANKKEIAFVLIQLAQVYQQLGQPRSSYGLLTEARQVAEEIGSAKEAMDASKLLAAYYAGQNDYRRAYEAYAAYSTVKDTLFEEEKARALTNYRIQYETGKKEQQIEILHQETAIQKLQLRQRGLLLLVALGVLLAGAATAYLLFKQRRLKAEARLQHAISQQQEKATHDVLDAEERERRRIAADLHDGVGQLLSSALLSLKFVDKGMRAGEPIPLETIDRAIQLVKESYEEMRDISHQMMPNALLKSGFVSAVREFIGKLDNPSIKISLHVSGLDDRLEERTETILYRIIQEGVTNVIKHAAATSLAIQLTRETEGISLTIEDNGIGFDASGLVEKTGMGLKNIQDRIAILKGFLEIDTAPSKGTLLSVFVPS
ncbi:tetratricopeptide repeat-containing sensor histidine kinase [Parapedobacter koreensis]|uniref:histidine kinase n=1 Tax=Parapedobacter koreensis TaxID=332977 RepID=A0A1H7U8Z9_9SPHI|nr:sensor histidine kinase [Parapedobacter koreensis]SEL93226.1 Signal transduction histidine kinase [Parapedobacter koreensis]